MTHHIACLNGVDYTEISVNICLRLESNLYTDFKACSTFNIILTIIKKNIGVSHQRVHIICQKSQG